jgi:hypothetical protein
MQILKTLKNCTCEASTDINLTGDEVALCVYDCVDL